MVEMFSSWRQPHMSHPRSWLTLKNPEPVSNHGWANGWPLSSPAPQHTLRPLPGPERSPPDMRGQHPRLVLILQDLVCPLVTYGLTFVFHDHNYTQHVCSHCLLRSHYLAFVKKQKLMIDFRIANVVISILSLNDISKD